MSSHHTENLILKYTKHIILIAIVYEIFFSKYGVIFRENVKNKTGVDITKSIDKTYTSDAFNLKNIFDNIFKKNNQNSYNTSSSNAEPSNLNQEDKNILKNFLITKVVDGDTVDVKSMEEEYRVRLIGINSPESVDPRRPVECYGKEASTYMKSLAYGKNVYLETDDSQAKYDKNGRLLAYVFLEDNNLMLNLKMISDGYAYEYTYNNPYKYQKEFKTAETLARNSKIGLWNNSTCNGIK